MKKKFVFFFCFHSFLQFISGVFFFSCFAAYFFDARRRAKCYLCARSICRVVYWLVANVSAFTNIGTSSTFRHWLYWIYQNNFRRLRFTLSSRCECSHTCVRILRHCERRHATNWCDTYWHSVWRRCQPIEAISKSKKRPQVSLDRDQSIRTFLKNRTLCVCVCVCHINDWEGQEGIECNKNEGKSHQSRADNVANRTSSNSDTFVIE